MDKFLKIFWLMFETLSLIVLLLLHIIDPQKPDGRARGASADEHQIGQFWRA